MKEKTSCCCERTTERSEAEKKKLLNRLSRVEGQIRGIRGMVERDAYCPDIVTQCSAAISALESFNRDLIGNHIRGCVVKDLKNGDESTVDELVVTIQRMMKA